VQLLLLELLDKFQSLLLQLALTTILLLKALLERCFLHLNLLLMKTTYYSLLVNICLPRNDVLQSLETTQHIMAVPHI